MISATVNTFGSLLFILGVSIFLEGLIVNNFFLVKNKKNGRDNVKVVPELGANAKGEQQGGIPVEMTDPYTSQVVDVRGTKRMRPDKKPVKATWY